MSNNNKKQQNLHKYHKVKLKSVHFNPYGSEILKNNKKTSGIDEIHLAPTQTKILQRFNTPSTINVQLPPKEDFLRLGYINANGIKTMNTDRYKEILQYINHSKCDVYGITETNVNWNNGETYRMLMREAKKYTANNLTHIIPSDAKVVWDGRYKPGGTVTIVTGKTATMITDKNVDYQMGRWSSVTIGPPKHELVIITAYIVNHTAIDPTKNKTSVYQQWQILSKTNNKYHPRRKAIIDLISFIQSFRNSGKELILFMDSNENNHMNKVFINKLK